MSYIYKSYPIIKYITSLFSCVIWFCDSNSNSFDIILLSFTKFKIKSKSKREKSKEKIRET